MDKEQREHEKSMKKMEGEKREAGENRFLSDDEENSSNNERDHPLDDSSKESSGKTSNSSFNAGGNDSDYDGGHPADVSPDSEDR